ncbi:kelch-like protein 7 isoform X2 [Lingula anatina]|uniref:Kelch-like protein 7 isoform X1 n=1 Tax=Lingula anatina TaxID=7574 RepID=A0A1S3HN23_LINAN|nr:kelch-like protein 7 isoform X1 [Lingula anatina]XP_013386444.1 kelch-like protein 7 isoform X2 [Lingula anatina]|eukprot:XP_013386442.1 kelch-like protein 7 isoform X1 [Lingula anatina]
MTDGSDQEEETIEASLRPLRGGTLYSITGLIVRGGIHHHMSQPLLSRMSDSGITTGTPNQHVSIGDRAGTSGGPSRLSSALVMTGGLGQTRRGGGDTQSPLLGDDRTNNEGGFHGSVARISERQAEFFRCMNGMRQREEMTDVILIVEGHEFKAHRVVLAACSSFFHAMFTSNMTEAQTSRVELQDIYHGTVEAIIDFAYTADIQLNDSNVQELLSAGNRYQIQPIKDACCHYLTQQLSAANCLGIKDFADFHNCPELCEAASNFAYLHFREVCQGEEFLKQRPESVTDLLSKDELTVKCEDEVYDAAIRWLKHDLPARFEHKESILGRIRFPLITRHYLTTHVQHEGLLQDNCDCLKMIIGGMQYHLLGEEERRAAETVSTVTPRRKKYDFQIACFGGSETGTCQYFNPKGQCWSNFPPMPEKRNGHSAVNVGSCVYIIGGSYHFPMTRIHRYSIATQRWDSVNARLEDGRENLAACELDGKVYICGGTSTHGSTSHRTTELFDPSRDHLSFLKPLIHPRFEHGLVVCKGFLYACGGAMSNNRPLKLCERFSTTLNKWIEIPPMHFARKGLGLAAVDGKIYAFGGQDELTVLDTVECYDPVYNLWTFCAKMPYRLCQVKSVVIGGSIWILSGMRDSSRLGNALEYKPAEDRWVFHYNTRSTIMNSVATVTVDTCVV